jgi:hypothetical protein
MIAARLSAATSRIMVFRRSSTPWTLKGGAFAAKVSVISRRGLSGVGALAPLRHDFTETEATWITMAVRRLLRPATDFVPLMPPEETHAQGTHVTGRVSVTDTVRTSNTGNGNSTVTCVVSPLETAATGEDK